MGSPIEIDLTPFFMVCFAFPACAAATDGLGLEIAPSSAKNALRSMALWCALGIAKCERHNMCGMHLCKPRMLFFFGIGWPIVVSMQGAARSFGGRLRREAVGVRFCLYEVHVSDDRLEWGTLSCTSHNIIRSTKLKLEQSYCSMAYVSFERSAHA